MKLSFKVNVIYLGKRGESSSIEDVLKRLAEGKLSVEHMDQWFVEPSVVLTDRV